ncbi:TonB-dependent receptor plug domain-containing protein [Labilibaculum sp.]|uniref:TonB-dependent receptor plug domain-containing protein n=1 Tax=Labilibaculum sp. TaxID=2060723 RepID=UPI002AA79A61|nr:TonB-dependent receptor plug domain-containing protein [Labilibaculum sp.]
MKLINNFDFYELSHAIGWTLIHSVWQAAVIGGIIWLIFRFISKDNAKFRYTLSGLGLILICAASAITFYRYIPSSTSIYLSDFKVQLQTSGIIPQDETFFAKLWKQLQIQLENSFPYLIQIWMIGMLFLSINLILKYIHTLKLKKHLTYPLRTNFKAIADSLVTKYNLKQNILFKESGLLEIPSVIGYFKPIVLIPVSMLSGIPENQLEIIIAHELAHIRRHDYLLQFIQGIIELIFFYHPVVWWLSSVVNAEREHICDDLAVKVCGESLTLIKALNNMEAIRKKQYEMVLGFSGKKGKVLNRIKRILRPKASTNPRSERFMLSGVFTLLFAGLFLISNFAISGNTDSQKALFSKINILDKTSDQPEKSFHKEALPLDLMNASSKNDQKKKKKEAIKQTDTAATEIELEEVTEVEEMELSEMPSIPVMPTMPLLPPTVEMPFSSFETPEFSFPKDSVKSDKWVKMKADEIIKEQLEAMRSAEREMKDIKIDLDVDQMRKELQQGLKDLDFNSVEFQNEMKEQQIEIDKQLKELSDGNYAKQQELQKKELENHLKEIEENSQLDEKEKEKIRTKLSETLEQLNSKEFQNQLEKQLESAKESLEQKKVKFESGEFENQLKEQRVNIQQQLKKIESPEFQEKINQQIKESKTRIQEELKRVNSDEYRKDLEEFIKNNPTSSLNYNSPELVTRVFHQDLTTPITNIRRGYRIPMQSGTMLRSISPENANKQPLIILDGEKITSDQMDQMSPDDIASISVLKDEASKALYGEEAKNGVIVITCKSNNQKNNSSAKLKFGNTGNPPLYILDGIKTPVEAVSRINPDDIESMNVLKGKDAVMKYGESAQYGAIEINSKGSEFKDPIKIDNAIYIIDGKKLSKKESEKINPDSIESITVLKGEPALEKYGKKGKNGVVEMTSKANKKHAVKMKLDSIKNPPIYVVDGKITSAEKVEEINPNDIESIDVLKGVHAIEKYGEEAKNGAVLITTKSKS